MTILTTTYNCENFIERCLYSIMTQSFSNFKCYITDDISDDNTISKIEKIIENDKRFVLIKNEKKLYQVGNYDNIIRKMNLHDEEICVEVDGDDWLPHPNVFEYINEIYKDNNVWMTSGSFKYSDGRNGFAKKPENVSEIRRSTFTLSHLRTWKSWLWKRINPNDLYDSKGNYWSIAGDLSFMFPMYEMSGEKNFRFIEDILYIYNETNPLNEHKVNMSKVIETSNIIRNKSPYHKIIK